MKITLACLDPFCAFIRGIFSKQQQGSSNRETYIALEGEEEYHALLHPVITSSYDKWKPIETCPASKCTVKYDKTSTALPETQCSSSSSYVIYENDHDVTEITFEDSPDAQEIRIHNCSRLVHIPRIDGLKRLDTMRVSCIDISVFDHALPSSLRTLHVTYANMTEFRPANIVDLAELDLSFNKLKQIPACLDMFQDRNPGIAINLKNNDFWFQMYTNLPDNMIAPHTVDELIRAHKYNLVSTDKLNTATRSLQQKELTRDAIRLAEAVQIQLEQRREQPLRNTTYANAQNIHFSSVQDSFRKSVETIMKCTPVRNDVLDIEHIMKQLRVNKKARKIMRETCSYGERVKINATLSVSLAEVLQRVYALIQNESDTEKRQDMMSVLRIEIEDAVATCFTGKITRIVNALSGYRDDVQVGFSKNEELANSIVAIRHKYTLLYPDPETYVVECVPVVWQLLEELCVPEHEHHIWLEYV